MVELLNSLAQLLYLLILLGVSIAALCLLLVSVYYFALYIFDIIFGDWLFECLSKGSNLIKFKLITKHVETLKEKLRPKNYYIRYETPLLAICFSLTMIAILAALIGKSDVVSILAASIIYVGAYLFGMKRKYADKKDFIRVLDTNLDFLKLSFVPLVFIITVVGFIFTFMGTFIGTENSAELLNTWIKYCNGVNISDILTISNNQNEGITLVTDGLLILVQIGVVFYLCSIPLQLFVYYVILIIKYFILHGRPYKDLIKIFKEIIRSIVG